MQNDFLNKSVIYDISGKMSSIQKFKFYKSILFFQACMKNSALFDKAKDYIDNVYEFGNMPPKAAIEILLMQKDMIMIKYLALKSI